MSRRPYLSKELRDLVSVQAQDRCGYCLTSALIVGQPMNIEHIIPVALGGATIENNLWLACSLCNSHKGDRIFAPDPETNENHPLFNPRTQRWADHFAWVDDGVLIIGLTAIGRATVQALQLNRSSLVIARRRWVTVGWHPPQDD